MTWHKFTITKSQILSGLNHEIIDDFRHRIIGASLMNESEAAVFATIKPKTDGLTDYYLTPAMSRLADDLIEKDGVHDKYASDRCQCVNSAELGAGPSRSRKTGPGSAEDSCRESRGHR